MLVGIGQGSVHVNDNANGIRNRLGDPNGWSGTGGGNRRGNSLYPSRSCV